MSITARLKLMQFLQFFLWGSWLFTFGAYAFQSLHFSGAQIGSIYGSMGIASLFMPGVIGVLADRWINKEKIYILLHVIGGIMLFMASGSNSYWSVYLYMLINSFCFMPSIPLSYSITYSVIESEGLMAVQEFPKIRVWGTVGFIVAMWTISLSGMELKSVQLQIGALAAIILGVYSLSLPKCPPVINQNSRSLKSRLGLDALVLFKKPRMALFLVFAVLLGSVLQISNTWGDPFIHSFANNVIYKDTLVVKYPAIFISLSQISETGFILMIPFFLRRFGIKAVMLLSIAAWVVRYGLFALGNPGDYVWMLIIAMLVYGCAFDFFNLSGSLFMELESSSSIRASAQGLFMIMVNGFGAMIGGFGSGYLLDLGKVNGMPDWPWFWAILSIYALAMFIIFLLFFKYKHDPESVPYPRTKN